MLFLVWLTGRLLVVPNGDDGTKDLEILVLRHQFRVQHRKSGRPKFTAGDPALLAVASRVLPGAMDIAVRSDQQKFKPSLATIQGPNLAGGWADFPPLSLCPTLCGAGRDATAGTPGDS